MSKRERTYCRSFVDMARLLTIYAILVVETRRVKSRERESERARERARKIARERESERARERERDKEREGPRVLGREPIVSVLWTHHDRERERERERNHRRRSSFVCV